MIKKIDHFVITTCNLKKCLEFYKTLGFNYKNDGIHNVLYAGDFKINVQLKGKELLPHASNVHCGSVDCCLEIEGYLSNFKKELEEKDLKIAEGIVKRMGDKGEMESFYIYDPDGNLLEFSSYKKVINYTSNES